jgi:hypothetical protein
MFLLLFLIKKCFNFYLGCLFSQLNIFGGLEQIRGPVESTIFSFFFVICCLILTLMWLNMVSSPMVISVLLVTYLNPDFVLFLLHC